jgi:predicted PurR-regulated permease PerM
MQIKFNNKKNSTLNKLFIVAIIAILFYFASPILFPILLAILLAFIMAPIANLISKVPLGKTRFKLPKKFSIVVAFAIAIILGIIIVEYLLVPFLKEINTLIINLPVYSDRLSNSNIGSFLWNPKVRADLPTAIRSISDALLSWLMSSLMGMAKSLVESTITLATTIVGSIVIPFLGFYFTKDWEDIKAKFLDIFENDDKVLVDSILIQIGKVLSNYIFGMIKLSLFAGLSIVIITSSLGLKYPLLFGFLAMMAETVPFIGPIVGSIPALFISYSNTPMLALRAFLAYIIFYQIDANYLMPKIMGKSLNLSPVIILISVFIGARIFGVFGVILAVPIAAVCKVLYDNLWHISKAEGMNNGDKE